MNADDIKAALAQCLPCDFVHVEGDGSHWFATIVSPAFEGLRPLQRQRLINEGMKPHLDSGAVHALSMKTLTPAQWVELQ